MKNPTQAILTVISSEGSSHPLFLMHPQVEILRNEQLWREGINIHPPHILNRPINNITRRLVPSTYYVTTRFGPLGIFARLIEATKCT